MNDKKSIHTLINRIFIIILVILFCISIISCMHITMSPDETFSMGLVKYNLPKMLRLNTLDVHPPLYYLLLKFFLTGTTFYTSSLAIKVIFARILSILISIIGFLLLYKIGNLIKIKQSYTVSFLLFVMIPYNMLTIPSKTTTDIGGFTSIRMYSLAFTLVTAEFYEALQFKYFDKNENLILGTLYASLASYTHNVAAIIAGIIIVVFMISVFKNKTKFRKFFLSGVFFAILYVPWLPIAIKQSMSVYHTNNAPIFNIMSAISGFVKLFIFLLILSFPIFSHLRYLNKRIKSTIYLLCIIILITFILLILMSPKYRAIYLYPIFSIYLYLCLNISKNLITSHKFYNIKYSLLIPFFAIIFICVLGIHNNNNEYQNPKLYNTISKYSHTSKRYIKLDPNISTNNKFSVINLNNDAIYTEYHEHYIYNISNKNIQQNLAATQSEKLRKYIYDNPLRHH